MTEEKKPTIDELLKKGSVTLTAKTRQEIYDQSAELTATITEGVKWTRTITHYNPETFEFEQTITIKK